MPLKSSFEIKLPLPSNSFNKLPWSSLFEFLLESNVDSSIGDLMLSSPSEIKNRNDCLIT